MRLSLLALCIAISTGCVSIPVPPFGNKRGEMGDLNITMQVEYVPKLPVRKASAANDYAWEQLLKSRTLKDK